MKKTFIIFSLLGMTAAFASCKKDYSCACTFEAAHEDHTHDESANYSIADVKKKDAEKVCDSHKTLLEAEADHSNVSCVLK